MDNRKRKKKCKCRSFGKRNGNLTIKHSTCHSVEKDTTAIKERCFFEGKGTVITKRNSENVTISFLWKRNSRDPNAVPLEKEQQNKQDQHHKKHAYAIRRAKIKLYGKKGIAKMTRKYSNQTYVQESHKNKNLCTNCKRE